MTVPHVIEPELLRPTPRRVRRRHFRSFITAVYLSFFFAISAIFIACTIGTILWITLVFLFGQTSPGTVTSRYTEPNSDDGTNYHVAYSYNVGGQNYDSEDTVEYDEYLSFTEGSKVAVKYIPLAPDLGEQLLLPGWGNFWKLLMTGLFFLVWCIAAFGIAWATRYLLVTDRNLVRKGIPTLARITHMRSERNNESATYRVYYEYAPVAISLSAKRPSRKVKSSSRLSIPAIHSERVDDLTPTVVQPASGKMIYGEMTIKKDEWDSVQQGNRVTVLYAPRKPKRSVIYQFADHQVVV